MLGRKTTPDVFNLQQHGYNSTTDSVTIIWHQEAEMQFDASDHSRLRFSTFEC